MANTCESCSHEEQSHSLELAGMHEKKSNIYYFYAPVSISKSVQDYCHSATRVKVGLGVVWFTFQQLNECLKISWENISL